MRRTTIISQGDSENKTGNSKKIADKQEEGEKVVMRAGI